MHFDMKWVCIRQQKIKLISDALTNINHSKLRLNYPTPKIPKNCASHQIKSGKSPKYRKVREGQKSGCSPGSNRENSQKPHWQTVTKMHLKRVIF